MPAVLEQRVYGKDARRAWRTLVGKYGAPAPGPAPAHLRVPPAPDVWKRIPSWEFHLANVDPGRARTVVGCAQRAEALERLVEKSPGSGAPRVDVAARGGRVDRGRDGPAGLR